MCRADGTSAALLVLLLVLVGATALCQRGWGAPRSRFCDRGAAGPYNIQLYDTPRVYPRYQSRPYYAALGSERCAAYCREDDCTVWCA